MPEPSFPHPSATVMLVRDHPRFEVLMVRRHHQIEFASGALVFPGGKLEDADRDPAWLGLSIGHEALTETERALRICAIREAYEESAILLASDEPGTADVIMTHAAAGREDVAAGRLPFKSLVGDLGLRLDLSALTPFAHWITPPQMRKRFDTRFYLMSAPADQVAACDGCETVDAEWVPPAEALRLAEAKERVIVFPTRMNLKLLAGSASSGEAIRSAAGRTVSPINPDVEEIDGGFVVSISETAGYGRVPPERL